MGPASQQIARRAHNARSFGAGNAARRSAKVGVGAQAHFGDDQQSPAARDDIQFTHATAEIARDNVAARLLQKLCGAFFGQRAELLTMSDHARTVRGIALWQQRAIATCL